MSYFKTDCLFIRVGPDSDFRLSGSGQIVGVLKTRNSVSDRIVFFYREKNRQKEIERKPDIRPESGKSGIRYPAGYPPQRNLDIWYPVKPEKALSSPTIHCHDLSLFLNISVL